MWTVQWSLWFLLFTSARGHWGCVRQGPQCLAPRKIKKDYMYWRRLGLYFLVWNGGGECNHVRKELRFLTILNGFYETTTLLILYIFYYSFVFSYNGCDVTFSSIKSARSTSLLSGDILALVPVWLFIRIPMRPVQIYCCVPCWSKKWSVSGIW